MNALIGGIGRVGKAVPRVFLILGAILLVVAVFLWFAVPVWVVNFMNKKLDSLPDYRGHIEYVKINLWDASMDTCQVRLIKRGGEIPMPFFVSKEIHISLQWSEILNAKFRSFITIYEPQINAVAGKSDDSSQFSTSRQLVDELKTLVPFRINRLDVVDGDLHFYDLRSTPHVNLEMDQINVSAENLTNSKGLQNHFPSTITITGRPLKEGKLKVEVKTNLAIKEPTFDQKISIEAVPATALNNAMSKYIRLQATTGVIEVFSEVKSEKGHFIGYAKPFFENVNFDPIPEDKDTPLALWSALANVFKHAFENSHETVATRVNLSGNFDNNNIDEWAAFLGVINNAWFTALQKGLEPIKSNELEASRRFEDEAQDSEKGADKSPAVTDTPPSKSNLPVGTRTSTAIAGTTSKLR